ncbi:CWC15 protein [Loa loa]|uniref:CWC15 protein n=1 Tax=Loa loa TaxID=7209 RepID=A0A1I7VAF6_LOALO|nr:CWC15 protein [Loa loa]EFO16563.1 CWC15 protein [Loa loa]
MTTAHRPTFEPARGGSGRNEGDLSKLSQQYSSKDMPSHTKLKYRQKGQGHAEDIKSRDFRRELEEKEKNMGRERRSRESGWNVQKKPRLEVSSAPNVQDEDDPYDDDVNDNSDEDEDDAAELMAELARIKKERALEKAQRDAALAEEQERIRTENILHGNPLLNSETSDFKVKRRWDDDVVFKNCAKGIEERKKEQVFINDAIRSEFHKKFMEKYIK